jgi:hypothetical protein
MRLLALIALTEPFIDAIIFEASKCISLRIRNFLLSGFAFENGPKIHAKLHFLLDK